MSQGTGNTPSNPHDLRDRYNRAVSPQPEQPATLPSAQQQGALRSQSIPPATESRSDDRLLNATEDGLMSKATNFGDEKKQLRQFAKNRAAALLARERDALFNSMRAAGLGDEINFVEQQLQAFQALGARKAAQQLIKNLAQRVILLEISPWLIAISLKVWVFQFICASIGLVTLGMWASSISFTSDSLVGKAISAGLGLFNTSIESLLSLDVMTLTFTFLAAIIGFIGFLGYMLFFSQVLKIDLAKSPIRLFILFLCLALTFIPISNLFPWLTLWVFTVIRSETSFLSMGLEQRVSSKNYNKQRALAQPS